MQALEALFGRNAPGCGHPFARLAAAEERAAQIDSCARSRWSSLVLISAAGGKAPALFTQMSIRPNVASARAASAATEAESVMFSRVASART